MAAPQPSWILFTDLDGTLLDAGTYSWDAARPALERLEALAIPWILCTGKTRAELAPLRRAMGHRHPCIIENGGAILIPRGYFTAPFTAHRLDGAQPLRRGADPGAGDRGVRGHADLPARSDE